jgi:hypothetical protein
VVVAAEVNLLVAALLAAVAQGLLELRMVSQGR